MGESCNNKTTTSRTITSNNIILYADKCIHICCGIFDGMKIILVYNNIENDSQKIDRDDGKYIK